MKAGKRPQPETVLAPVSYRSSRRRRQRKRLLLKVPSISKMWSVCTKIALIKKTIRKKNSQTLFCCLCVYLPTFILWWQLDKLSMSYSVRFKWKRLIPELAALNISIRRVIFTSGQNLKPPFLCQYLIFFHDIFFTLEISVGSLLKSKNRILNKITDLKVYRSLKQVTPDDNGKEVELFSILFQAAIYVFSF